MNDQQYQILPQKTEHAEYSHAKLLYAKSGKYEANKCQLPHNHSCTELVYVVHGQGQFRVMDALVSVSQDDMIIIHPQADHTEAYDSEHSFEYIVLGVEGLNLTSDSGSSHYLLCNLHPYRDDFLILLNRILQELFEKNSGYLPICQNLLEILIALLVRHSNFQVSPLPACRASKECAIVKQYIDTNFKQSITLDQLAAIAHVNKYYLVHSFSREYNTSPINYLIDRRVRESCDFLCNTNYSLTQISQIMGFSSPSYFSQSFRKVMGISPLEYRKQTRSNHSL